jgi:hypothetical protein
MFVIIPANGLKRDRVRVWRSVGSRSFGLLGLLRVGIDGSKTRRDGVKVGEEKGVKDGA